MRYKSSVGAIFAGGDKISCHGKKVFITNVKERRSRLKAGVCPQRNAFERIFKLLLLNFRKNNLVPIIVMKLHSESIV